MSDMVEVTYSYMYGNFDEEAKKLTATTKKEHQNHSVVASDFRVVFSGFGDAGRDDRNFGRHVRSISLPSIHFTCRRLCNDVNESIYTADSGTWSHVTITLKDDTSNEMMYQVMRQIQKQRNSPKDSHFSFTTELHHANSTVAYRRYIHTGCTILTLENDIDLTTGDPRSVEPCIRVNVDKIETTGWIRNQDATWLVDVDDDEPVDIGSFLGIKDPVYAPIKR